MAIGGIVALWEKKRLSRKSTQFIRQPLQNTLTRIPPPTVINPPRTTRGVTFSSFLKKRTDRAITKMGEDWVSVKTIDT